MRRLGRLAAKIRLGFLEGLRGRGGSADAGAPARRIPGVAGGAGPDPGGCGVETPAGGRVVVRRTLVEEIEIHEPDRR